MGLVYINLKAHRRTPVSGTAALIGKTGTIVETTDHGYAVRVQGEIWSAVSQKTFVEISRLSKELRRDYLDVRSGRGRDL